MCAGKILYIDRCVCRQDIIYRWLRYDCGAGANGQYSFVDQLSGLIAATKYRLSTLLRG